MFKTCLLVAGVLATGVAATALAGDASRSGRGRLSVEYRFDDRGGIPVEGAVSYIIVRRTAPGLKTPRIMVLRAELWGTEAISTPVTGGLYRLSAYQRACDGNCSNLAPPSNGCRRDVRIHPGDAINARILVRWSAPDGATPHCRIAIAH